MDSTNITATSSVSTSAGEYNNISKRDKIELWLNQTDQDKFIHFNNDFLADPLYYSNKLTQVLEEINNFDREYIEGKTPDLEPKHIFTSFLICNIHFLYENKYLNQLLVSKSLVVRRSVATKAIESNLIFNRENLSLSLLIKTYLAVSPSNTLNNVKRYISILIKSNLDAYIGNPHAKIIYQKFSIADIEGIFDVLFLEELDKKQDYTSIEVVLFLALNSLQNIDDTQKIDSLKERYLKLLSYIFKYNIPSTSKSGSTSIGKCEVPLLFFINKYFGDSDTNRIGWKMFLQWTKSITSSSTPRKLINALGILNSFGPESTLVKNHIDMILICLQKIFFCSKHEALCDMNTQCLNNIIKVYPSSIPMEMANKYIEFIYTSPGFLNNPKAFTEKGRSKNVCFYYRDLFLTLNQYIPGCGIKYATDIANLNNQESLPFAYQGAHYFVDEYFSGADPQLLKNHPKYENFMEMFLSYKAKYSNSLITHLSQIKLKSALDLELKPKDYMKIIKRLKTETGFSISSIKPHIEKIMKGILDSSNYLEFLECKQFIIDNFCMDESDLDFLLKIIDLSIKSDNRTYIENSNVVNCIKLLLEINSTKMVPFIKRNISSPTQSCFRLAYDLHRFVDMDDEVIKMLNNMCETTIITSTPMIEIQTLMLSLDHETFKQFYPNFLKNIISSKLPYYEFIILNLQLLKDPKLEVYGHNRVELVKIFYKTFLQPSNYKLIPPLHFKLFLDPFQYIEPNDPIIQEFKSNIIEVIQKSIINVLEILVYIKSSKIKSLFCVIQEIVPSLKINEKTLESKDINSVSTLTQRTIIIDIIKYYFFAKKIKMSEILNLCRVSKLFLSVCQNLFKQIRFNPIKNDGSLWKPSSSLFIQTTPFSLAHKGIYHMNYEDIKNVYHNKINKIFYQLSSLSINFPHFLYELPTALNELIHLEFSIYDQQKQPISEENFKKLPSLESIKLNYDSKNGNELKEIINYSLKYCPNLKEICLIYIAIPNSEESLDILLECFELLKSRASNSGGSFKSYIHISKIPSPYFTFCPIFYKILPYADKFSTIFIKGQLQTPVCIPYLKIENFNYSYLGYDNFFDYIRPKKITYNINSLQIEFFKNLKNLLKSARFIPNPPTELTFKFNKFIPNFIDYVQKIIHRCRKSKFINVFNIQHTDPTITSTLELCDFSKYHRFKLISPISGRFELQTDYENESDISDDSADDT